MSRESSRFVINECLWILYARHRDFLVSYRPPRRDRRRAFSRPVMLSQTNVHALTMKVFEQNNSPSSPEHKLSGDTAVHITQSDKDDDGSFGDVDKKDIRVWKRGPRRIEVSITVQSVENIDNTKESVDVGMLLDVYWLPSAEELESKGTLGSAWDFEHNFQTINAIVDNERNVRKKPRLRDINGVTKWYAQLWISSTFKQHFDMHSFPLDCQRLICRFEMGQVESMIYVPPEHQSVMCSVERELCPLTDWSWQGGTSAVVRTVRASRQSYTSTLIPNPIYRIAASVVTTGTDRKLSKQANSYAQMIIIFVRLIVKCSHQIVRLEHVVTHQ